MNLPSFGGAAEYTGAAQVPAQGKHNASLKMEYKKSAMGNDMLVAKFTIDAGADAGMEVIDYLSFAASSDIGHRKLEAIARRSRSVNHPDGFQYTNSVPGWPQFAQQFNQTPALRVEIDLYHSYSIEVKEGQWQDKGITLDQYEAHDGRKSRKAVIRAYAEPTAQPSFNTNGAASRPVPQANSMPAFGGPAPSGGFQQGDGDNSDLPF
jgi:hypothetical protein